MQYFEKRFFIQNSEFSPSFKLNLCRQMFKKKYDITGVTKKIDKSNTFLL